MKVGFIGSGDISRFHINALLNNKFNIEAIGTRPGSANCLKFAQSVNLSNKYCKNGWKEVLKKEVDAFCICVDIGETPNILFNALKLGKPIFVEKPISFHLREFEKLVKNPMKDNIFVGYNRRYYNSIKFLKKICDNSITGGTVFVNIPDSIPGHKQFLTNSCHIIDLLIYVLGDFQILESIIRTNKSQIDFSAISALCKTNKWSILLNAHSGTPANFSITINIDDMVYDLKPIEKLTIYSGIEVVEPSIKDPIRRYIPKIKESLEEPNKFKPGFNSMYKNFAKFINNEKAEFCSIYDAEKTVKKCWELIGKEFID